MESEKAILIGEDLKLSKEKLQDGNVCCLITGQSGSGKTVLTKKIINSLNEDNSSQIIVIDFEGEYNELRNNKFKVISLNLEYVRKYIPEYSVDFSGNLNKIQEICNLIFSDENINYIIDLSGLEPDSVKNFIIEFTKILINLRKRTKPCCLIIDNLSICYRYSNTDLDKNCKNAIVMLQKLARSRFISLFFISQRIKSLPKDITSECNTMLMGKIPSEDFERNALYIGVNKNYFKEIINYDFIAYGHGFDLEYPVTFDDFLEIKENDFETIKKECLVTL